MKKTTERLDWKSKLRDATRFQLKHLLYVAAVLGVSVGLFGVAGIGVAALVVGIWWQIFLEIRQAAKTRESASSSNSDDGQARSTTLAASGKNTGGFTLLELLVVILIIGILLAVLIPMVHRRSSPYFRRTSYYHTIQIALMEYHDQYETFPPACLRAEDGTAICSWRVLLLPQLGHQEVYDDFHFDEPWNGPRNSSLLKRIPWVFQSEVRSAEANGHTTCHVVSGPDTMWPDQGVGSLSDVKESSHPKLLFTEVSDRSVPWTSPESVSVEDAARLLTRPPRFDENHWRCGFFRSTSYPTILAMTDGGVQGATLRDPAAVRRLCLLSESPPDSAEGGDLASSDVRPWRRQHYGNWFRLALFMAVVLWPVAWVREEWRPARSVSGGETDGHMVPAAEPAAESDRQTAPK